MSLDEQLTRLLQTEQAQSNPAVAGGLVAIFMYQTAHLAHHGFAAGPEGPFDRHQVWNQLCTSPHLNADVQALLQNQIDASDIFSRFIDWVRAIYRTLSEDGVRDRDEVVNKAAILTYDLANLVLNIANRDDPRARPLVEQFCLMFEVIGWVPPLRIQTQEDVPVNAPGINVDDISEPVFAEEATECPICHDQEDNPVELNACTHVFCRQCIHDWVAGDAVGGTRMCPVCRSELI